MKRFRHGALAAVVTILILFLMARLRWFVPPGVLIFGLVCLFIVLSSLVWWAWGHEELARAWPRSGRGGRWRPWILSAWGAYILWILSPFLLTFAGGRGLWDAQPAPLIYWAMIWHMLVVVLVPGWGVGWVIVALLRGMGREPPDATAAPPPEARSAAHEPAGSGHRDHLRDGAPDAAREQVSLSRRSMLRQAVAAAPLVLTGAGVAAGTWQAGDFRVRRLTMSVPRLPERLTGLTLTHISDLHVGRLFRPDHLSRMVDEVNALDSDMVMVTGDIVDHSNDFLPEACDAIGRLEHRHGCYLVIGNHDLIDNSRELLAEIDRRSSQFVHLADASVPVEIGGETIEVAGLFWSRYDTRRGDDPGHAGRADRALARIPLDRFTVALAHHPHAFDALADRGADLTLAGHTHGGQFGLPARGDGSPRTLGHLLFRYIWGEYRRGEAAMYVNAGVGNWFPVRINAPAEIVQIRLV